jgi:hypothetical protein
MLKADDCVPNACSPQTFLIAVQSDVSQPLKLLASPAFHILAYCKKWQGDRLKVWTGETAPYSPL